MLSHGRIPATDTQWEKFSHIVETVLDEHAPLRRVKIRNPAPPPISDDTRELIIQRRQAMATDDRERYAVLNAEVKRAIRRDYRGDIQRRVEEAPPSALWRQLRSVIAPKKGRPAQPENLTADRLNAYFTTVGETTRQSVVDTFRESERPNLNVRLPRVNSDALRLTPITLDELKQIISSLPHKTSVADNILDIKLIKLIFPVVGRTLLQIINKSIVTETVPESWKTAVVTPLHKKGDLSTAENFRPITNVPTITKIIEKVVHTQVESYLSRNCLHSSDQHGFRCGHSTTTALISVTDHVMEATDRGDVSIHTLIDLSRAFDVVDHQTLLDQLQRLQIAPGWFASYLEGHKQCVRTPSGEKSALLPIKIGIFQGSCLGPLLYNISTISAACYVPTSVNSCTVQITRYADDTQVVVSGPKEKLSEVKTATEEVLDTLATYFLQNGMKINAAKTELMVIGGKSALQIAETDATQVHFMEETLQPVPQARNLGVIFDERLTFEPHIDAVVTRCMGILMGLMYAKQILPRQVLPVIVRSLVLSHVQYCCQVFAGSSRTALKRLQKIQNFAARIISGRRKYDRVSGVIKDLKWLPVDTMLVHSDLCLLHKVIVKNEPDVIRNRIKYNRDVTVRRTRFSNHLYLPRFKTNVGQRTFNYRACKLYNAHVIGTELERLSYLQFKKALKKRFLSER